MSIWKGSTGKIVKNATGKVVSCADCPCDEEPCVDWTAPPDELTVDIGAGGWTEENGVSCNDCQNIVGEFVLDRITDSFGCTKLYSYSVCNEDCDTTLNCDDASPNINIVSVLTKITATVVKATTASKYTVTLQISVQVSYSSDTGLYACTSSTSTIAEAHSRATYTNAIASNFPITLSKSTEVHTPAVTTDTFRPCNGIGGPDIDMCSGALPATITIDL